MKLRDVIPDYPLDCQVRCYGPEGEDMLFGYCCWTGEELISVDDDSYYLDEEISKYELDEENKELIYWIITEWING